MTGDAPDATECFSCGQSFARDQLEEVGDTVFCRDCHARMLRRIDERRARGESSGPVTAPGAGGIASGPTRVPSATGSDVRGALRGASGPISPLARPAAADAPCFVCGGPLDGATLFELRGFAICGNCARGLIGDEPPPAAPPAMAPRRRDDDDDDDDDLLDDDDDLLDDDLGDAPRPIAPEGSSRVVTPGAGTEWCTGCSRRMPGPGSYQLIAGRPYCPACVAMRSRQTGPIRVPSGPPPAGPDDAPPPDDACDACDRTIDPAQVLETQGFRLCAACRNSDPELALAIARSRHQRRLARAGRRLLDGLDGDDD
jgi:hypothetical protein